MAASATKRWTSRALNKAIDVLDRAESSVLGRASNEEESDDVLNDPRVIEWIEDLKEEMKEEIELQRSVFESKIKELEADETESLLDAVLVRIGLNGSKNASLRDKIQSLEDVCFSSLSSRAATEQSEEKTKDNENQEVDRLRQEVSRLRTTFEAARATHEYEIKRSQEEITQLKIKHKQDIQIEIDKVKALHLEDAKSHAAADAAASAALFLWEQQQNAYLFDQANHTTNKTSAVVEYTPTILSRRQEDAISIAQLRHELDQAKERTQRLEDRVQRAEREAQRAEQARAKLDTVLRSFQKQKEHDASELQQELENRLLQLEHELKHRDARLGDLEIAKEATEKRMNDSLDAAALAHAEQFAARAALNAAIAQRDNLARRLATLLEKETKPLTTATTKHNPPVGLMTTQTAPSNSNRQKATTNTTTQTKKQKGLAALFLEFVDGELLEDDRPATTKTSREIYHYPPQEAAHRR